MSTFGRIEAEETLWRQQRGAVSRPFRESAGLDKPGCYSQTLKRAAVDFGIDQSFEKASQKLREHYGLCISATRVRRESLCVAASLPQESPEAVRTLAPKGADVIVAEIDGTMIPTMCVPEGCPGGERRKHRKVEWKEMRLMAAQAQGSTRTHYGAGFDNPEQAGARWTQVVKAAGWAVNSHVHGVGDGAGWINTQFTQHFGAHGSYLLDLWHVSEYIAGAAPANGDSGQYLERTREALRQNKAGEVLDELAGRIESWEQADENAPVRRAHRYLDKRRDQLDYQGALKRGLPVGSGLIESGHRHVLQARLKIPGAWWKPANAHAMAQLRVLRANSLWHTLWDN